MSRGRGLEPTPSINPIKQQSPSPCIADTFLSPLPMSRSPFVLSIRWLCWHGSGFVHMATEGSGFARDVALAHLLRELDGALSLSWNVSACRQYFVQFSHTRRTVGTQQIPSQGIATSRTRCLRQLFCARKSLQSRCRGPISYPVETQKIPIQGGI